jgi:hypothetical protein
MGQEITGGITGLVRDEQGAVIPGADVTATHVDTNTKYLAVTGDQGRFRLPLVRLGTYEIAVELTGFNRAVVQDILVETGSTADINVTLQVGSIQQEVIVTGGAVQEIVNTVDAELGSVVDKQQVLDLPLNGRNASHLALLQAGVFFERSPDGQGDKLIIHGQRHRSLNITLDGVDTQDNLNRASSIMLDSPLMELSAEHVQEFKVVTGISNAEYTRGGSHISAVTRGGSNDWHGSVFWFHRNDVFNANDFFNNSTGTPTPKLIRNQFGGSFSGPIVKDKTFFYFGYEQLRESRGIAVNRTVWTQQARQGVFRYLDGLRNTPENVAANPDLVRSVNLLDCGSGPQSILGRDCLDERFDSSNPPTFDPLVSGPVMALLPLPNNSDLGDGLNYGGFRFNSPSLTFLHKPAFRIDHAFNQRHTLYFSFNYNDREIQGDFINGREPPYPGQEALGLRNTLTRSYAAAFASTLSPSVINEFRAGAIFGENSFLRNQPFNTPEYTLDFDDIYDPYDPGGGDTARLNRTYNVRDVISWIKGDHQIKAGFEWRRRYVNNRSLFQLVPEIDFNDSDNPPDFSGSDMRKMAGASNSPNSTDRNNAEELLNNLIGAIGDSEIRYNATSPTSGFVEGAFQRRIYQNHEFDWFLQDNWNVSPRLTLNLGLRWEYQGVPDELQGMALMPVGGFDSVFGVSGQEGFFNPGVLSGSPCSILDEPTDPTDDNARALVTGCATKYDYGGAFHGKPFYDTDKNNFGPVIGLAWDPMGNGKTSVRAGFRISYQQDVFSIIDGNIDDNEGLRVTQICNPVDDQCINNPLFLREVTAENSPNGQIPDFEVPASRTIFDSTAQDFRTFAPGLATPYYQEWTLGIQREIIPNWALDVRYVGNRGVKQRRVGDYNEMNVNTYDPITGMTFLESFVIAQNNLACNLDAGKDSSGFADNTGLSCIIPNPLMADLIAGDSSRLDSTGDLVDALTYNEVGDFIWHLTVDETSRPSSGQSRIRGGSFWGQVLQGRFPVNFFNANPFVGSARSMINDGSSTYHAVEIEMRRRFSRGFTFQANYTYGKSLADYDGDSNTLLNDTRPSSVIYPKASRQETMPRHLFNVNWLYELPFGPGKRFVNSNNVAGIILGGWNFGGLINYRSGRPLSFYSGIGSFHRSAISDDNTVTLAYDVSHEQIRELTGRQDIGGGIFWWDPCMSSQLNAECASGAAVPGLFDLPEPGTLGELGESTVFGPSAFSLDFNLRKITRIGETTTLEFRWEVFNALNNVSFANPATSVFSASFGQILRTVRNPRLMQFALRLNF